MKKSEMFSGSDEYLFIAHCSISPLYSGAAEKMKSLIDFHATHGNILFRDHYIQELDRFKDLMGKYFNTSPENMAVVKNTTERSEEHTSELQSRGHLVCRLLLEKKKTNLK